MFVKQISVFLENKSGRLAGFTKVLAESSIDIFHITVAETEDYGIVRCVTKDNARAVDALKKAGFSVSVTDLIGVEIGDEAVVQRLIADFVAHGLLPDTFLWRETAFRIAPPLIITDEQIRETAQTIRTCLDRLG